MCKVCQTMIGCSCYCKDIWRATEYNNTTKKEEQYCSKCNHATS